MEWYKDCKGLSLLSLRILVAAIFLYHGIPKLLNISGTMSFFSGIGLPGFLAVIVGIVEVVAGILLLLGLWTKWSSYALAIIIAGAIIVVHTKAGGISAALERDVLIFVSLLVLAHSGAGSCAIDNRKKPMMSN